ncbi:UDP-N-acetylmuramoyl-tripeptide--D-alanyl-D-alanine ligase [bacterium]|nr:UDP-N-acetylmuramoyl-tripeptide--D-alanyl-D-alanine ligase [bacterium]
MIISLQKIASLLGGSCDSTLQIHGYAIDSRKVEKGSLFFALKGARVDGHDYLKEVSAKGAFAAVVDKDYKGDGFGLELLFVEDVLLSLQALARSMLVEKKIKVIGITGSVGKTTTKDMVAALLSKKFSVHANKRSYNSQTMLPISILESSGKEDFLVLEMAMQKKGEIEKLVSIAPPDIVVMTPITYCHSENFNSLEEIAEAKAEIFTMSTEYAVIHADSAKFDAVYRRCFCVNILYPGTIPVASPFVESHFTENFCAAYEVAKYLGMSDDEIRLASLSLVKERAAHRFNKVERDGILFIDDSYNANVLSSQVALENMPAAKEGGKKILVFGEMAELGSMSAMSHAMVADTALEKVDVLLTIGRATKNMVQRFTDKGKVAFYHFDYRSLKDRLYGLVKAGDVVLIKGSNSHKLWKLIENTTQALNLKS